MQRTGAHPGYGQTAYESAVCLTPGQGEEADPVDGASGRQHGACPPPVEGHAAGEVEEAVEKAEDGSYPGHLGRRVGRELVILPVDLEEAPGRHQAVRRDSEAERAHNDAGGLPSRSGSGGAGSGDGGGGVIGSANPVVAWQHLAPRRLGVLPAVYAMPGGFACGCRSGVGLASVACAGRVGRRRDYCRTERVEPVFSLSPLPLFRERETGHSISYHLICTTCLC